MKIIKLGNNITVVLEDGAVLSKNNCTSEFYEKILYAQDDEEAIKHLMVPEMFKKKEEAEIKTKLLSDMHDSEILTVFGIVYILSLLVH